MPWKKLIALILIIAVAFHTLSNVVIVGGFYASAYARACENKAKPWLKCGGRCQMMKKLKAEQKSDQQAPLSRFDQVLSSKSFFVTVVSSPTLHNAHIAFYKGSKLPVFARSHFHPPGKGLIICT